MADWDPFADPAEAEEEAPAAKPAAKPAPKPSPPKAASSSDSPAKPKADDKDERYKLWSRPAADKNDPDRAYGGGGYPTPSERPTPSEAPAPKGPPVLPEDPTGPQGKNAVGKKASKPFEQWATLDNDEEEVSAKRSAEQEEKNQEAILQEVERLKLAKKKAVEEEEFEEAAALKRRIAVLESSISEHVRKGELAQEAKARAERLEAEKKPQSKRITKFQSQMEHGEALYDTASIEKMKLIPEEKEFMLKSKMAMKDRGVTDDLEQGVPQWAYEEAREKGPTYVKTARPAALQYIFKGQIEDEKWEDGSDFQVSFNVEVPPEVAFKYIVAPEPGKEPRRDFEPPKEVGPGQNISYEKSGIAQLNEMVASEMVDNELVVWKCTVHKPRVPGKVKLEAAKTVKTKEPFNTRPFYSFKSVWRIEAYPSGGTRVTRMVKEFKQYELPDFDALDAVSRSIELENEEIRKRWVSAIALAPSKKLAVYGQSAQENQLAKRMGAENAMYSASFIVDGWVDSVYEAMVSNELLYDYHAHLEPNSFLRIDEKQSLLRQSNGIVLLNLVRETDREYTVATVGHKAGNSFKDSKKVKTTGEVTKDNFYRLTTVWTFSEQGDKETLIKRTMKDFKQTALTKEITDLANVITENADLENRKIIEYFSKQNADGKSKQRPVHAISQRANYAMRRMPELLDHAAKNNVMEVREMLEVKGADPNYIHVRRDGWTVSDSRLEFYEEMSPLIVAAERGATDVMKVLFNHPHLDANLCCCAFNDMEIYNYYTAYDMTISRRHPHAAALLRAHGVLPAASEHVWKPEFDRVHQRPKRENIHTYEEDEYGEGEMPAWDVIAEGNPALAQALESCANTLSLTRVQTKENREKILKELIRQWHPDRHSGQATQANATKVFQWLQVVKTWYMDDTNQPGMPTDMAPLPGQDEGFDFGQGQATQMLHPSGSVFTVW
mmetsp:Transcript_79628/g.140919  ORF Transcript_79628/g.140919 Transcript_79628/m.140919 type:complete len:950 (-) Transcript_79628:145-2994(-)